MTLCRACESLSLADSFERGRRQNEGLDAAGEGDFGQRRDDFFDLTDAEFRMTDAVTGL